MVVLKILWLLTPYGQAYPAFCLADIGILDENFALNVTVSKIYFISSIRDSDSLKKYKKIYIKNLFLQKKYVYIKKRLGLGESLR